ncbi:MAG: hypothetical protein KAI66_17640 [Lentisphaeria bacterium]|nr:hypothetical protein [Lentisphaeria bacterium]
MKRSIWICLLLAFGCSDKTVTDECRGDADCGAGSICDNGTCVERCASDLDCPSGQICESSICREGTRQTPNELVDEINLASNTIAFQRLPAGTTAGTVAEGQHDHSIADLPIGTTEGTVAEGRHDHDIADLPVGTTEGTVAEGRHEHSIADLPVGTTADTVAEGQHEHSIADLPVGTTADTVAAGDHAHTEYLASTGGLVTGTLRLTGGLVADSIRLTGGQFITQSWTRIGSVSRSNASDYTFAGLDGDAYRRFRIELEGVLSVGGTNRVIGLRPNGSNTDYGPHVMHWDGHVPGVSFVDTTGITGSPTDLLPLCVTHSGLDGHLFCTGEMNIRSGRYRMIHSRSTFASSGACGSSSCIYTTQAANSWRNSTTNITSLTLHFGGATLFDGEVTLWALE